MKRSTNALVSVLVIVASCAFAMLDGAQAQTFEQQSEKEFSEYNE